MEDNKLKKLNIPAADLPEVKRTVDGKIDLEAIATGKTEKDFYIVPDEIIEAYYKELPDNVWNESRTAWTYSGGLMRMPTEEVRRKGAEALNARLAQRKSFAEAIDGILSKKANKEAIEDLELKEDATNLDMIIAAALKQAARGNAKAWEFLRDTVGEKPTEKIAAEVETITPEDRRQIERILNRDKTQDIV
jgi:hypothetical protein